jgi:hyperosmotically inducible protein
MKRIYRPLLVCVLAFTGLAADKNDSATPQHMDPYVQGPANEARLIQAIRHQLVTLPYYGVFDDIGFTVDPSGRVTLLGQVVNPINKTDAEVMVKKGEGVTSVTDSIEVLPLSQNDDRIRRAVYRAIYGDPALSNRYGYRALPSIHIIVKNGNVRLEGVVANEADRNLSFIRANGVPGVFKVENALQVEAKK